MSRLAARALLIGLCLLGVLGGSACSNSCYDLANQVCACQPDQASQQACNQRAKDATASYPLTSDDQSYCQSLLDQGTCECFKLQTPEGRIRCGLTYSADGGP